ncbi:EAL domain-containing protein [Brucepastera parasyntrophica]|uniref:EAL domain-containing protein n=1 Tax=Brucepastera parasyntrophica TaxID=2880008 RepID=UPI00210B7E5C|nr:EAL domain-containing protein [Brucepastera parasyntrophica]ULQ58832.1 EAL domain-containing protein [Brucepastera parasyntrophica]
MIESCTDFVLQEIIENEHITTYFQPIVSMKTGTIFAYEALVRGVVPETDTLIQPAQLFERAEKETVSVELDRLCQKKALETFSTFKNKSTALMFMNINTAIISSSDTERPHINIMTNKMGFDPHYIGLELIESRAQSVMDLINFVNHYRDSGFLIVIDDFGCEHSNLERLIQIHPDIIKIDRNIISGIAHDSYRQSILKSIHLLAEMTGSLCLAEGVETLEEIETCHLLGVDLFQGFAIAKPSPNLQKLEEKTLETIDEMRSYIHKSSLASLRSKRRLTGDVKILADWLVKQINPDNFDSMKQVFQEFIAINPEIECIYLLDAQGTQLSETIFSSFFSLKSLPCIFSPAKKGSNHSLKAYYICFEALGVQQYLTDVYLSLASGNLCRTFSVKMEHPEREYILCIDFLEEAIRTASGEIS